MKLVTFDAGRVGRLDGDRVVELDCPSTRAWFEAQGRVGETGEVLALADVRLRAPIVPKKFFQLPTPEEEADLGPKEKIPPGIWFDTGSRESIAPGEFLAFSLPANHFSKRWDIQIPFSFDLRSGKGRRDNNAWGGYTRMFLIYSFSDLPSSAQQALRDQSREISPEELKLDQHPAPSGCILWRS